MESEEISVVTLEEAIAFTFVRSKIITRGHLLHQESAHFNVNLKIIQMYSYSLVFNVLCLCFYIRNIPGTTSSMRTSFQLIEEEAQLIRGLQEYIDRENERLKKLKTFKETLTEHAKVYASIEEFASNPLAIFKGMKHLTIDLEEMKQKMVTNSYDDAMKTFKRENSFAADVHRLYQEIRNIISLQRAYNLSVMDIMTGRIAPNRRPVRPALSLYDCFIIGKISADYNDHETSVNWLQTCAPRFDDEIQDRINLILVSSYLYTGNKKLCLYLTHEIYYDSRKKRALLDLLVKLSEELDEWWSMNAFTQWASCNTCAGDYEHEWSTRKRVCRYNHENSPFLIIAPLKEEEISLNPRISVYREVIYDSEIERLKTDAYEKLTSGKLSTEIGRVLDTNFRAAHSMFLDNIQSGPRYLHLRNRLTDISLLSLHPFEKMQIIYYVPGGFIRVHNDFLRSGVEKLEIYGQRQGQVLLYLSDVTWGGETVFPWLRVRVTPEKGSVLWWPNVKVDGSQEVLADHISCPTVYGEKIAAVQWLRMKGQDHWITRPEDKPIPTPPLDPNEIIMHYKRVG